MKCTLYFVSNVHFICENIHQYGKEYIREVIWETSVKLPQDSTQDSAALSLSPK
jgi:hypothetical protein